MGVWGTKTSWPPSTAMKPKPFSALNHFTVPCATCAPTFVRADDPARSRGRVSLFRPSNTNVELEPRGTVQELVSQVMGPSRVSSPHVVPGVAPGVSGDETGLAQRLQRGLYAVGGADDGQQRV